jgi:hypothetical protein
MPAAQGAIQLLAKRNLMLDLESGANEHVPNPMYIDMARCKPGWLGDGYKTMMPGNDESSLTCMQPFIGSYPAEVNLKTFAEPEESLPKPICNVALAERLTAPYYYQEVLPNGAVLPLTGNVPLVQTLGHYDGCVPYKTFMDPIIQNYGPASGVDKRTLKTTLTGTIANGPVSTLLSSAELRGFNPSQTYMMTFDPSLSSLLSVPANEGSEYPYAQPFQ